MTGDVLGAKGSFKKWKEIAPKSPEANFMYGEALARNGELEAAREAVDKATSLDPKYLPARIGKIKLMVQERRIHDADIQIKQLRAEFGDRVEVLGLEGWYALLTGDYAAAAQKLEQATAKKPDQS